jgi:electron transport complex protein RnfC
VTGQGINQPRNIKARIGTPLKDIFEFCGGLNDAAKIIFGGPMMGIAQYCEDVPVMKGTSGILVLTEQETNLSSYQSCIACGRCVEACPMRLVPSMLSRLGERGMWKEALDFNLLDCVECGSCTYVCPANRPIVHFVKYLKTLQREAKAKGKEA